ncbi:MAG: hypothetical protein E7537_04715 [Ruminococcaceae bacterium]|nr:hypothetical protein [Oscillospiraceae bacterium]
MDTFFEQIVAIKKDGKYIASVLGVWFAALFLCFLTFLFSGYIGSLFILVMAGIIYGAFKLSGLFNIEYEYIVTNGVMDIDKIINKSSRKRLSSFELSDVSRLEKFNAEQIANVDKKNLVVCCNPKIDDAYLMVYKKEGKNAEYVVFSPNQKMQGAIIKFLPKFIANSAFK